MSTFNKNKRYHKSTGYHRACATVSKVRFVHSSVWKEVQWRKRTGLILFGSRAAEKGPFSFVCFFFKIFLHAFYRTDMNLMLIFFWFFQKSCLTQYSVSIYSISLVTLHSLPPSAAPFPNVLYISERTTGLLFSFFSFLQKGELHAGEWHGNTKSGQRLKGVPRPAMNKHKQETSTTRIQLSPGETTTNDMSGGGSVTLVESPSGLPPPRPAPPPPRARTASTIGAVLSAPPPPLCHVSNSWPASGTMNTVMSSPEPSFSLGSRQPRSLSTPRDLIKRSWAASVYLWNRWEKTMLKHMHLVWDDGEKQD